MPSERPSLEMKPARRPSRASPRHDLRALYLQYHSIKNRIVMRIKRLKQPKYLLGGIVGGLYFYWYFFRTLFGTPAPGAQPSRCSPRRRTRRCSNPWRADSADPLCCWPGSSRTSARR